MGKEIDETLDFVILATDGRYIYHPDASRIMARTLTDYASPDRRSELASLMKQMVSERTVPPGSTDGNRTRR